MLLLKFMLLLIGFGALACTVGLVMYAILFLAFELDRILRAHAADHREGRRGTNTAGEHGIGFPSTHATPILMTTSRTDPLPTTPSSMPLTARPRTMEAVRWHAAGKLLAIGGCVDISRQEHHRGPRRPCGDPQSASSRVSVPARFMPARI